MPRRDLPADVPVETMPDASWLAPGFIDLQVNGFGGVDFLEADALGYARAGEALLETGVTGYLPTLITTPEDELVAAMKEIPIVAEGPRILGIHLEGPFLSPDARGAHDPEVLIPPTQETVGALLDAAGGTLAQVTIAPELPDAEQAIGAFTDAGVRVAVGHTTADFERAEFERVRATADPAATLARLARVNPLGRLGLEREVAALAAHLLGDESAWTTGTVVPCDGGATAVF